MEISDMFTGIIERLGKIQNITAKGSGKTFIIETDMTGELKVDQSVSHDGVCLTVEEVFDHSYQVTAIEETLKKSNLGALREGSRVNLERCMVLNGRLDGHMVQGHVDTTAKCLSVTNKNNSWEYEFLFDKAHAPLVIEKGSICLNGISLTLFDVKENSFKVAIIPFTYNHTNIRYVQPGDTVNIEFDVIGKYISRFKELENR